MLAVEDAFKGESMRNKYRIAEQPQNVNVRLFLRVTDSGDGDDVAWIKNPHLEYKARKTWGTDYKVYLFNRIVKGKKN